MRVCKHGCEITRILISYVLSDARFDWLVGNMSVYQENLFQSRSEKKNFGGVGRIIDSYANPRRITVLISPNSPSCLHEAM